MNDETIRLILDLANSSKDTAELSTKLRVLEKDIEKTGVATEKFTGLSRDNQMRMLNWGRGLQDFAQGGFPAMQ